MSGATGAVRFVERAERLYTVEARELLAPREETLTPSEILISLSLRSFLIFDKILSFDIFRNFIFAVGVLTCN